MAFQPGYNPFQNQDIFINKAFHEEIKELSAKGSGEGENELAKVITENATNKAEVERLKLKLEKSEIESIRAKIPFFKDRDLFQFID